jgi:hypothetical protein
MSQENVRSSAVPSRRTGVKVDGTLRCYDPEIEWTSTEAYIERATYRGHEGVRRYLGRAV